MVIVDSKELHNTITQHIRTQLCKLCSCVLSYSVVKSFAVWMSVCKTTLFDYIATSDRRYRSVVLVTVVLCCVDRGPWRRHSGPSTPTTRPSWNQSARRIWPGVAARTSRRAPPKCSVSPCVPRAASRGCVHCVYRQRRSTRLDTSRVVRQAMDSCYVDTRWRRLSAVYQYFLPWFS